MSGSHTGSQEWQSFEVRMRQRRVERCLIKADVALDAGFVADAREALEEARCLSPLAPALVDLERRLIAVEAAAAAEPLAEPEPTFKPEEPASPEPASKEGGGWRAFGVGALLLGAAGVLSVWLRPVELRPLAPPGIAPSLPLTAPTTGAPPARAPSLTVATDSVTAPEIYPELEPLPIGTSSAVESVQVASVGIAALPPSPDAIPLPVAPPPSVPSAATAPLPPVEAPRAEPSRGELSDAPSRARLSAGTLAVAPVSNLPPAATSANANAPVPPPGLEGPANSTVGVVRSDEQVRSVLARYETAYSTLDAAAAAAVYPEIDRAKLARAFEALAAQQISLGSCSIQVVGTAATADCAGSATWVPKVGGGTRTQARRWRFELRLAGNNWQIADARVR